MSGMSEGGVIRLFHHLIDAQPAHVAVGMIAGLAGRLAARADLPALETWMRTVSSAGVSPEQRAAAGDLVAALILAAAAAKRLDALTQRPQARLFTLRKEPTA